MFFFFFQAEDGIRDYKVTGVQTCALPIWVPAVLDQDGRVLVEADVRAVRTPALLDGAHDDGLDDVAQIGRASCREKSVDLGGRRIIKKKKKKEKEIMIQ